MSTISKLLVTSGVKFDETMRRPIKKNNYEGREQLPFDKTEQVIGLFFLKVFCMPYTIFVGAQSLWFEEKRDLITSGTINNSWELTKKIM